MYLEKLSLLNFKNYEELKLDFSSQVNIFSGPNGSGKTNLLDSVYYLSLTKSAFNNSDALNVRHGEGFFMISGDFVKDDRNESVRCNYQAGQKKTLFVNKIQCEKFSEHIGVFPVVLISPNDSDLIREGSEERRKFADTIISQIDRKYLNNIILYNQILKQRNSLIKQFNEKNTFDPDLLDSYDVRLISTGKEIYERRRQFTEEFIPLVKVHYRNLADTENIELEYISHLREANFPEKFKASVKRDIITERTHLGVHRDDFSFLIKDKPLKNFGSQGQQKSYIVALKLAQFDIIKSFKGFNPILLLDDIFDKLDEKRIGKLMEMVAGNTFGQIFITDARIERNEKLFGTLPREIKIFRINHGKVVEE